MFLLPVVCPRCGTEIKCVERKKKFADKIVSSTLCVTCKEAALVQMRLRERSPERTNANSKRMASNNPMSASAVTRAKMVSTKSGVEKNPKEYEILKKFRKIETKEETSARMRLYNPMHNAETVDTMKATLAANIKSGDLVYTRGVDHHLWKGNRDFNNSCRRDLYPVWTFYVLERDGFKCTSCGTSKNLQVHHLKPLRDFISEVKIKYNIKMFSDYTAEELLPQVAEVVANHKLEHGITVCSDCHYLIDNHYYFRNTNED